MKGLALAEAYYDVHGKPMIQTLFPDYQERIAVGLVGQGSECFGFDDVLSTDHDFGPSFCLWLTTEDYQKIGYELQKAYDQLPQTFMGFEARVESAESGGRVGVHEIGTFYRNQIGSSDIPSRFLEWLQIPEFRLATVTNGRIFHDPLGDFSRIRNGLLDFYPEDIRLKKMAARAVVIGQSGQYNYARSMCRNETVAAHLAISEFIQNTISLIFLMNKKYTPFYKWMHRALQDLPILGDLSEPLRELSLTSLNPAAWENSDKKAMLTQLNRQDRIVEQIEEICKKLKQQLQITGLTNSDDDFLTIHAGQIMARISDSRIRSIHVMEG